MNTSSHFCIFSNILLSQWNSPTNRLCGILICSKKAWLTPQNLNKRFASSAVATTTAPVVSDTDGDTPSRVSRHRSTSCSSNGAATPRKDTVQRQRRSDRHSHRYEAYIFTMYANHFCNRFKVFGTGRHTTLLEQGSYRSWKTWNILEFDNWNSRP